MKVERGNSVLWNQFDGFKSYQAELPRGAGKVFEFGRMK